jgi:hypothetical protein
VDRRVVELIMAVVVVGGGVEMVLMIVDLFH